MVTDENIIEQQVQPGIMNQKGWIKFLFSGWKDQELPSHI